MHRRASSMHGSATFVRGRASSVHRYASSPRARATCVQRWARLVDRTSTRSSDAAAYPPVKRKTPTVIEPIRARLTPSLYLMYTSPTVPAIEILFVDAHVV